jgi:hypothetical protein
MPTPSAPVKTAKAVRSMPIVPSAMNTAAMISSTFSRRAASSCSDGVAPESERTRASSTRAVQVASHSSRLSQTMPVTIAIGEIRRPPTVQLKVVEEGRRLAQ